MLTSALTGAVVPDPGTATVHDTATSGGLSVHDPFAYGAGQDTPGAPGAAAATFTYDHADHAPHTNPS